MRFNRRNWNKFFNDYKSTTIRLKPQRIGKHNAWAGSYYHSELLGTFYVVGVIPKLIKDLDNYDARLDGFNCRSELISELKSLNHKKIIGPDTMVFINHIENPMKK